MGFQAILEDGSVIAPAVDVLDGILKPRQANDQYRGVSGVCPHCRQLRDQQFGTDNLHVQQALSVADLTVGFRCAVIGDGERMLRVMHFAHRAGFLASPGACLLCRDNQLVHHAAAVKVIGRWAERHWPGCTVKAEMQILVPGAPPVQFRPDISVTDTAGRRVACIEYQRTKEDFDSFKARDELRCSEFGEVLWFFEAGAYSKSLDHRDYFADRGRRFFKTWIDHETGGLQYEEGVRGVRRAPAAREHQLGACSEESLLRAIDPPDQKRSSDSLHINTALDMKRAGIGQGNRPETVERAPLRATPEAFERAVVRAAPAPLTALDRIKNARRMGQQPSTGDRIAAAIDAGNWTAQDIQRWDHSQGFGVLLRIKQIEQELRRGVARR